MSSNVFAFLDRAEIYQKLVAIKPFYEKVSHHKSKDKKIFETAREETLVRGAGGAYFIEGKVPISGGGAGGPRFLLF